MTEILQYWHIILLVVGFGAAKGVSDKVAHDDADGGWWTTDWLRKWEVPPIKGFNHWWYCKLHTPKAKERFPFSSTILVFLTDAWHFFNWIQYRCFHLALALLISNDIKTILILILVAPIIQGVAFQIVYKR